MYIWLNFKEKMDSKKQINCIIIDDDEIDRLTAISFIKKYDFLKIIGVYSSANEAIGSLYSGEIVVVFSDIDMPEMSGLELRKAFLNVPACIFITSYPDYAAESFDVDALDFIVKPIKAERMEKCMERLQKYFEIKQKATLFENSLGADTFFIKDGHNQIKINLHEVLYLEALKDYTRIITTTKKHAVLFSLGNLLQEPTFSTFKRIHRSYAVQPNFIDSYTTQIVNIQQFTLPVGRSYKDVLLNLK
jgi:two-component system, LytTR family, response regulator